MRGFKRVLSNVLSFVSTNFEFSLSPVALPLAPYLLFRFPSSLLSQFSDSRYVFTLIMAPTKIPAVDGLTSVITPSSLFQHFSRGLVDTELYKIRAPLCNEQIFLPNPPPMGLVDA